MLNNLPGCIFLGLREHLPRGGDRRVVRRGQVAGSSGQNRPRQVGNGVFR